MAKAITVQFPNGTINIQDLIDEWEINKDLVKGHERHIERLQKELDYFKDQLIQAKAEIDGDKAALFDKSAKLENAEEEIKQLKIWLDRRTPYNKEYWEKVEATSIERGAKIETLNEKLTKAEAEVERLAHMIQWNQQVRGVHLQDPDTGNPKFNVLSIGDCNATPPIYDLVNLINKMQKELDQVKKSVKQLKRVG